MFFQIFHQFLQPIVYYHVSDRGSFIINSSWMRTLLSKPLFAYFKSGETITKSGGLILCSEGCFIRKYTIDPQLKSFVFLLKN